MKTIEKRDYIQNHLHEVKEPALDELYKKMVSLLDESLIEESEDDIKKGNLTSHAVLKKEIQSWRHTK
jgi:hypothetical protein